MSRSSARAERADVYNRITTEIIAAIEAGARNWRMPWHHDGAAVTRPENFSSHKRYRGVNVLALWAAAQASGYASGLWGTYRQWLAADAQVRKGERGTTVVFWKQAASNADQDDGDQRPGRMFARAFTCSTSRRSMVMSLRRSPYCQRPNALPMPKHSSRR